jgi:hypothetical protein
MFWMSIEVLGGGYDASRWKDPHETFLVEAAVTNGGGAASVPVPVAEPPRPTPPDPRWPAGDLLPH